MTRYRIGYADGRPDEVVDTLAEADALVTAEGVCHHGECTWEIILPSEDIDRAGVWDTQMSYGYCTAVAE